MFLLNFIFNHRYLFSIFCHLKYFKWMLFYYFVDLICWDIFCYNFISYSWNKFCSIFYLFVISIRHLNWLKICKLYCLIICHSFSDRNWNSQTSLMLFFIVSFISYMLMSYYWFIICVVFLNWHIFNCNFSLRLRLGNHTSNSLWSFYNRTIQLCWFAYRLIQIRIWVSLLL